MILASIFVLLISISYKNESSMDGGEDINFIPQSIREHSDLPEEETFDTDDIVKNYTIENFDKLLDTLATDYNVSEEAINKLKDSIWEMDEIEFCNDCFQDESDRYNDYDDDSAMYRGSRI